MNSAKTTSIILLATLCVCSTTTPAAPIATKPNALSPNGKQSERLPRVSSPPLKRETTKLKSGIKPTPGSAELGIVNVTPVESGPFYVNTPVRMRVTVRNSGSAPAHVKAGIIGRGARLESESTESLQIAAGGTVTLELDVNIPSRKVNDDRFSETVHLMNADIDPRLGVLKRAWKDAGSNDNSRRFTLPISAGVYKVRVDLVDFSVNSICHDNPGENDKWFFALEVSRTDNSDPDHYLRSERGVNLRWPSSKFVVVRDGQRVAPRVHLSHSGFDNHTWLLASVHMDQTYDRMKFQWDQIRYPGNAYLKLSPDQWRRGGTFTTRSRLNRIANNSCEDGAYTVTWRVRATPEPLL